MKLLVTGGAGFIGSNFVYYMLDKYPNYEIFCLDKLTYAGNMETLAEAMKKANFHFIKGDIKDDKLINDLFEKNKFDKVVNFAAETHVDRSVETPDEFFLTNALGVTVLLNACRKYKVERFHQVSTDEVYGDLPLNAKDLLFTEETPIHASSPYSASKASGDLMTLSYFRTFGLPVTISRCSNNYGPYQFPEKLIPLMITRAMANKSMPVYGSGTNVRDWLHVHDHCTAIDLIIHHGKIGNVYNIGGHNERTNLEVIKVILETLKKPESLIEHVTDRPGHDLRYAIDPTKIVNELGWKPIYNFESGLKQTIEWNIENVSWLQHILEGNYKDYYDRMYNNR